MKRLEQKIKNLYLSEKSSLLQETQNQYVFEFSPKTTKLEIREIVERIFEKKVKKIRTCNYSGKAKRWGRGVKGKTAHWKKAIVQLEEDEKFNLA